MRFQIDFNHRTHSFAFHVVLFLTAFLIVFSRRPDALLLPQFWAEDGALWFAQAYNQDLLSPLVRPVVGYYQTVSRLAALLATAFPLRYAPLVTNLAAIVIKILPLTILCSQRFDHLIPNIKHRLILAFLYLALPNSFEVHANITNAHWHLALLVCLIFFATPGGRQIGWKIFDFAVVAVASVSGPFSIFILPLAIVYALIKFDRHRCRLLVLLGAGASVQLFNVLLTAGETRLIVPLGANLQLFAKILGGQIFLPLILGQRYAGEFYFLENDLYLAWLPVLAVLGLWLFGICRAPLELRLFNIFAALVFAAALVSPMADDKSPQWEILARPGVGGRYWFLPMLGLLGLCWWGFFYCRQKSVKTFALSVLILMPIGICADWKYAPYRDYQFQHHAESFEKAAPDAEVRFPLNPTGWEMKLTK